VECGKLYTFAAIELRQRQQQDDVIK